MTRGGEPGGGGGGLGLGPGREFDLLRSALASDGQGGEVVVGPGDDAAVLEGGLVLSCDLSVEDVHFRRDWLTDREIGYRATAAALSDLAAMAARPSAVLVSYGVPVDTDDPEGLLRALAAGTREAAEAVGARVAGGDLTRSRGPLIVDALVVGRASSPVLRSGARPGDAVFVTGALGASAAAAALLTEGREPPAVLRRAFARPVPRTREALWLVERTSLHALVDLSDGLGGDAGHLAAASGVRIVLETGRVPVAPGVADAVGEGAPALAAALSGGEDYELCFAAPAEAVAGVAAAFHDAFGIPLTRVGRVEEGQGVMLDDGERLRPAGTGGFDHFDTDVP